MSFLFLLETVFRYASLSLPPFGAEIVKLA